MAASLWACDDPTQWQEALDQYDTALAALQKDKLTELDRWYLKELPQAIASRDSPHITRDDLVRLVDWKLSRGKWRPRLQAFAAGQEEGVVEAASQTALQELAEYAPESPAKAKHLRRAIEALTALKGVGAATASAVAAACCPHAPFMSDEALAAAVPRKTTDYSLNAYLQLTAALQAKAKALGAAWTATQVERALWVAAVRPSKGKGAAAHVAAPAKSTKARAAGSTSSPESKKQRTA